MKEEIKNEILLLISKINSDKENNSSNWDKLFAEIKSLYEQAIIYNYLNKKNIEHSETIVNIEETKEVIEIKKEPVSEIIIDLVEEKIKENIIVEEIIIRDEIAEAPLNTAIEQMVPEQSIEQTKEKTAEDVNTKNKKTDGSINEKIGKGKSDATLASKLQKNPITNIYKAISINDRFLFTKELFKGNREAFNDAANRLNEFNNFTEAETFIKENFGWDYSNNSVEKFMEFVQRRYL